MLTIDDKLKMKKYNITILTKKVQKYLPYDQVK